MSSLYFLNINNFFIEFSNSLIVEGNNNSLCASNFFSTSTNQVLQNSTVSNLMRLRSCALGHSDPQLYNLSQNSHQNHNQFHHINGLLGFVPNTSLSAERQSNTLHRRSFLSSSPLTTKLKVFFKIFFFFYKYSF